MKLVNYKMKHRLGSWRIGFSDNEKVIDIQDTYKKMLISKQETDLANAIEFVLPADPNQFFTIGSSAIEKAKEVDAYYQQEGEVTFFSREDIILGTPIPEPSKIICVGKNYADHAAEMNSDIPEYPVLFAKFSNALIGPEERIEKSAATKKLDYEVELGIVIGREASQVNRNEAYNYIAGYTIGNDISARDLQMQTPQWLQGKTLDKSTPIGPWVVTSDEIRDPSQLTIRSIVNGEERQSSNTAQLIFNIPFLIEFISGLITLKPGDIILTGTPDGVGVGMNPPKFLNDGDMVTVEIENVGQMENRVIEQAH